MFTKGFWALQVAPGQTYTQIVSEPFRITMATLVEENNTAGGRTTLVVRVNSKEHVLCTLRPGQIEQQRLGVAFGVDEEVSFSVRGSSACNIQLTGNTLMTEEDIFQEEFAKLSGKLSHDELISVLNRMGDPDDEVDSDDIPSSEDEEEKPRKRMLPEEKDQHRAKLLKTAEKEDEGTKKSLPSGLIVKTVKEGSGPIAKPGDKVGVRYSGRLENGKLFDKSPAGKTFGFTLGESEVIKGWDLGIPGMKVGEVRTLTIPAALAYGAGGALPQIPQNATLIFQVKLVSLQ